MREEEHFQYSLVSVKAWCSRCLQKIFEATIEHTIPTLRASVQHILYSPLHIAREMEKHHSFLQLFDHWNLAMLSFHYFYYKWKRMQENYIDGTWIFLCLYVEFDELTAAATRVFSIVLIWSTFNCIALNNVANYKILPERHPFSNKFQRFQGTHRVHALIKGAFHTCTLQRNKFIHHKFIYYFREYLMY